MDFKGDENCSTSNGNGTDKRKLTEADANPTLPKKKVCTERAITSVDSPSSSTEVSTSNLQDSSASSSVNLEQSQDFEDKLSFLASSGSYLENQSLNIGSTTESLDGLQSEVSLSDINVDSFISDSCETSQAASGSTELKINSFLKGANDPTSNIDSTKDLSNVVDSLNTKELKKSETEETSKLIDNTRSQETKNSEVNSTTSSDNVANIETRSTGPHIVSGSYEKGLCSSKLMEVKEKSSFNADKFITNETDNVTDTDKPLPLPDNKNATSVIKDNSIKLKTNVTDATEDNNLLKSEMSLASVTEDKNSMVINDNELNNKIKASATIEDNKLKTGINETGATDVRALTSETDLTVMTEDNALKTKALETIMEEETSLKREATAMDINKDNSMKTKKNTTRENDDVMEIKPNTPCVIEDNTLEVNSISVEKQKIKEVESLSPESQDNSEQETELLQTKTSGTQSCTDLKISKDKENLPKNYPKTIPKAESEPHSSVNEGESTSSKPLELNDIVEKKLPDIHLKKDDISSLDNESTETPPKKLSFKKSLENITLPPNNKNEPQVTNIDLPFVSGATESIVDSPKVEIENEVEQDKKSEISNMEIDTPMEGSLLNTPCESGETSPSTSTPIDSCQASAAPSPLLKDDANLISESLLYDESSVDTKEPDEEEIKPVKLAKKKRKKAPVKPKKPKAKTTPVIVDEETRMSGNGTLDIGIDEDSQSSTGVSKKEPRRYRCEVINPESTEVFTADKVNEYLWPLEGIGEHYFIQEHISRYLGIMSFKRKYPDLRRRPIESQEKEYLKDLGLVSEMACDLGLTAVRSEDLLDIMFSDFPGKYEELQRVLRERKERQLKETGKVEYQVVNLDKSKMQEYSRKAALNASKWNAAFNREKNEERKYSFDLQTFTLHVQTGHKWRPFPLASKMGSYPVAVLPGQYTDYCKRYSYNELRGMPLQTVMAGPFTAEELAAERHLESDGESAAATYGVPDIKEEADAPPVVDPLSAEKQPRCKVCNGGRARNKDGKPEPLIICGTCRTASHPTCIDLTLTMIDKIESYSWQCMACKTCAQCNDPDDEERMIFCDMCDRGYHIYCVGLRRVPNGRWHCKECAICYTCGTRNPAGTEHIKNAEWQHEFKKNKDNKQLRYTCTLCVPCDKYWKRRQFCSVCMKVYRSIPEDGMVRCSGCPKYVHKDGCSILHENERYCNICFKSRNKTALNHSRIIAAAKKKMATGGSAMWK